MPAKYPLSVLQERANRTPNGRAATMLSEGTIDGPFLVLDDQTHLAILARFPPSIPQRYPLDALQAPDAVRPVGFVEFVLSRGTRDGDEFVLDTESHRELIETFYPTREPTLAELATNFTSAIAAWGRAGFRTVDRDTFERRQAACDACPYWDAAARGGLGKCSKCGCSKAKLWLVTSTCPDSPPRW